MQECQKLSNVGNSNNISTENFSIKMKDVIDEGDTTLAWAYNVPVLLQN